MKQHMTTRFPSSTSATRVLTAAVSHDSGTPGAPLAGAPPTSAGSPRRTMRGGVVRAWAALAAIAVAGLGAATLPVTASAAPGSDTAIPHRNEILHTRNDFSFLDASGDPVRSPPAAVRAFLPTPLGRLSNLEYLTPETERWSAVEPLRERSSWAAFDVPGGPSIGTSEQSYTDGTLTNWQSWIGDATTTTLSDEERSWFETTRLTSQRRWMINVTIGADPIGGIRAMLDGGMLRNAGTTEVDGRRVLRLLGEEPGTEENDSPGAPIAYEYLVDPHSLAPVRVSSTMTQRALDAANVAKRYTVRWDFSVFEYLPLNESTRHLLVAGGGR